MNYQDQLHTMSHMVVMTPNSLLMLLRVKIISRAKRRCLNHMRMTLRLRQPQRNFLMCLPFLEGLGIYKALKELYEDHVIIATRLSNAQTMEIIQERNTRRDVCVRSFLLYLLGCTLFSDKSNKQIDLIYLQTMEDFDTMSQYSWERMALAYLYHCLSEVYVPKGKFLGLCKDGFWHIFLEFTLLMIMRTIS